MRNAPVRIYVDIGSAGLSTTPAALDNTNRTAIRMSI
jgi:hypothetical protein